ncbi:endoglin [Aix galericulata]|nr:endoglin [Aix galericulata]
MRLAPGGGSERGAGWAANDARGLKKLPFPPAAGRKVSDGVLHGVRPEPRWGRAPGDAHQGALKAAPSVLGGYFPGCRRSRGGTRPCVRASVRPAPAQAASRPQDAFVSQGSPTVQQRELPAAASKGQLLDWARGTYGGITSYSELRDPRAVHLRLGEGASGTGAGGEGGRTGWHQGVGRKGLQGSPCSQNTPGPRGGVSPGHVLTKHGLVTVPPPDARSPPACVPQERFNAAPHLDAEVFSQGMRSCASGGAHSSRTAHIIQLQPEHRYRAWPPPGGGHSLGEPGEGVGVSWRPRTRRSEGLRLEGVSCSCSSPVTEVNLSLSCPEPATGNHILILQSRANFTWILSPNSCHISFLVSGIYRITSLPLQLFTGDLLPDTEQGLVAKAFEKNYSVIASYSIIPVSPRITLEIQEREVPRKPPPMPTSPAPTLDTLPNDLLLMLRPWKCTDDTLEIIITRSHLEGGPAGHPGGSCGHGWWLFSQPIKDVVNITLRDISCQAEKNATHFMLRTPLSHCGTSLESQGNAKNELILSLSKGSVLRSARVAFQCQIPRELFLRLFPTAAFEAPQTELEVNKEAFVQASMRWDDYPADLQLKECWLVAAGTEPLLLVQANKAQSSSVAVLEEPPGSRARKVWRFRFTYAVPEGSHVPFTAALKCKAGLQVGVAPPVPGSPSPFRWVPSHPSPLPPRVPGAPGYGGPQPRPRGMVAPGRWRRGRAVPELTPALPARRTTPSSRRFWR